MSAGGITYDGVPGARGTLFKDLKFFVSLRVPGRVRILDLIKQNGGTIAKLETQADHYITYDTGPKPSGSLDWKFVRDSVDNGAVQETDKYEMHQTPTASRPVGSSRPAGGSRPTAKSANSAPIKGTRTPFNTADDESLARWVLSHAANKKSGNEIYQTFEGMNNRHTWHSWRDRWVKKLSKLPPAELEKMAANAPDIALPPPPAAATPSKRSQATRPAVKKAPPLAIPKSVSQLPPAKAEVKATVRPSSATHQPAVRRPLTPAKRAKFTEAEDDLLIREAGRFGGTPDTKFFKKFSERHSSHSEAAWKRHWTQILEPRLRESSKESLDESGLLPEESSTVNIKTRPDTAPSGEFTRQMGRPQDERPTESNSQPTETSEPKAVSSGASPAREEVEEAEQSREPKVEESQAVTRQDFYDQLWGYRKFHHIDTQTNPEIKDQSIDLWLLWQAVGDQYQKGAVEIDWAAVADKLGFHIENAQLVQQCFADHVAGFAASGLLDEPDVESEDDEVSQPEDEDAVPDVQLEPPQVQQAVTPSASRKRQAIVVETSGFPSTPNSRKKRQRLGPDDEIPSTPDDKLGLASFGNLGPSPSLSVKQWTASEEQVEGATERDVEEEEPEEDLTGKPRRLEPETQDFGFDDAFNATDKSQDSIEFDISPSQQLLGEEESVTPVPLSYKRDKGKGIDRNQSLTLTPVQEWPAEEGEGEEEEEEEEEAEEKGAEEAGEAPKDATDQTMTDSQESTDKTVELQDLMDRFVSFGYPREDIVLALMATSLCTPLATSLVKYLKEHKDIPNNWQGVWTINDDKRLRRIDAAGSEGGPVDAKIQKYWDYLESKHTRIRIAQRRKFLAYLDETGQSSQ
ncbi:hypothetical protein CTAM01_04897 [Colletotrichum tamarilloi]|uniref:DNA-binding protein RAP1 n=1 Tax=Colletotrichum tamarilloi TaxID=1209934 RepID=A0ABQ9RGJ5_9PEZI|nr:uncharacterized protein CTAM01_04897 [Colletotrichum tamarilloi]KAK1502908.1 hypothetical protein CTAM01_04897 [Colletotrichum tamarilloi]